MLAMNQAQEASWLPREDDSAKNNPFVAVACDTFRILARLGPAAVRLYLALLTFVDTHDPQRASWPSYETLRKGFGLRNDAIAKGAKSLERAGLLQRRRRYSNSNQYWLSGWMWYDRDLANTDGSKGGFRLSSPEKRLTSPSGNESNGSPEKRPTVSRKAGDYQELLNQESHRQKSQGNKNLPSASLRSAALEKAARTAEEGVASEMVTTEVAMEVLKDLREVPAFNSLDLSKTSPAEVLQKKLAQFFVTRQLATKRGQETSNWFLRCLTNWLEDMWDPYNKDAFQWGEGAHLQGLIGRP